jgi:pimeloyl-ACP methyl ester carboxylesterase
MVIGRAERRRRGLTEIDLPIAAQFPDQVAGMVLLDSAAPKLGLVPPTNTEPYNFVGRASALLPAVAHLRAGRLVAQMSYGSLPPRSRDEARANSSTARHFASFIEELDGSASMQASLLTDLGGKPLIVLTADRNADDGCSRSRTTWPHCRPTVSIVTYATHTSLSEDEADSAAGSQAVHHVVVSVRISHPLPPQ